MATNPIIDEIGAVDAEIKELTARKAKLLDSLALEEGDRVQGDYYEVVVSPNNRFDEALAFKQLPPELLEQVTKTTIDTRLLQAKISPDEYKALQSPVGSGIKREIKVLK